MATRANLEQHQRDLLYLMVEANRQLPQGRHSAFVYQHLFGNPTPTLELPGHAEPVPISWADIEALRRAGVIAVREHNQSVGSIDLMPVASQVYDELRRSSGEALQNVEEHVRQFLDSHAFRQRFSLAYDAWRRAADLLWSADSATHLSAIGHHSREALQEFAAALVGAPSSSDPQRHQTVDRIRTALTRITSRTDRGFAEALLAYWGTVSDLAQRQEHAGQKDGVAVTWNDARRVVFQTAIVMFEIASAVP